jgi:hypothetical protein
MTRKRRRLYFVLVGMLLPGSAAGLVPYAVSGALVFFYSPSDLQMKQVPAGRPFRLGGLVRSRHAAGREREDRPEPIGRTGAAGSVRIGRCRAAPGTAAYRRYS